MMEIVAYLLVGLGVYAALGLCFAGWFVIAGVGRISPAARGSGWGFRVLILPGSAALWPVLAWEFFASRGRGGVVVGRALGPDDVETAVEATDDPSAADHTIPSRRDLPGQPSFVDPEAETSA
jgi:hypothetical protein